jgi:hypothetical protein
MSSFVHACTCADRLLVDGDFSAFMDDLVMARRARMGLLMRLRVWAHLRALPAEKYVILCVRKRKERGIFVRVSGLMRSADNSLASFIAFPCVIL